MEFSYKDPLLSLLKNYNKIICFLFTLITLTYSNKKYSGMGYYLNEEADFSLFGLMTIPQTNTIICGCVPSA